MKNSTLRQSTTAHDIKINYAYFLNNSFLFYNKRRAKNEIYKNVKINKKNSDEQNIDSVGLVADKSARKIKKL